MSRPADSTAPKIADATAADGLLGVPCFLDRRGGDERPWETHGPETATEPPTAPAMFEPLSEGERAAAAKIEPAAVKADDWRVIIPKDIITDRCAPIV